MALELGYLKGGNVNSGFSILNYVARSLQSAVPMIMKSKVL